MKSVGFVYCAIDYKNKIAKIGHTTNLRRRMSELRKSSGARNIESVLYIRGLSRDHEGAILHKAHTMWFKTVSGREFFHIKHLLYHLA